MNAPVIARIVGALFLIAGIAGFLPWVAPVAPFDAPVVTWDTYYRMLFWVFPVNIAHDAVHVFFGVWGLVAGSKFKSAVTYCRFVAWVYLLLAIFGIIPLIAFNTVFGIAPIYGWDTLLHFVTALICFYGGYGRASIEGEPEAA